MKPKDFNIPIDSIFEIAQETARIGYYEHDIVKNTTKYSKSFKKYVINLEGGDNFIKMIHPKDRERVTNEFISIINSNEIKFKIKYRIIRDDDIMIICDKGYIIRDDSNKAVKIYGFKQDITDTEKMINENQQTIKILTNQNEKLNDLAYMLAHNIKSPVSNLKMLFNLLDKDCLEDGEMIEFLNEMRVVVDDLLDTLTELNDTLVVNTLDVKFEDVHLETFINKIINANFKTKLNDIDANVQINCEIKTIKYAKLYLKSYLINLISNAIKYSSPDRKLQLKIIVKVIDDKVNIFIKDNGLGINLEKYGDKLFKLKETFHGNKQGKGLGLFIVHNQLQALNGTIECDSDVDVGTIFRIIL